MAGNARKVPLKPTATAGIGFRYLPNAEHLYAEDLGLIAQSIATILREVSRAIVGREVSWELTGLSLSSIALHVAPVESIEPSADVASAVFNGLRLIESRPERPPYYSVTALRAAEKVARASRGRGGLVVEGPNDRFSMTYVSAQNVAAMLAVRQSYLGSLDGSLDILSVHRGPNVTVFGTRGEVVRCRIDEGLVYHAKDLLGRRVLITGMINANAAGDPVSLDAHEIFASPAAPASRSVSYLYGAIPDFTGDLGTLEYLEQGWGSTL